MDGPNQKWERVCHAYWVWMKNGWNVRKTENVFVSLEASNPDPL